MRLIGAFCQEAEMSLDAANRTRTGGNQPHIVIPYNYADHEFARKLAGALRRDGISPWVDELDMSAGAILTTRMASAARPVDFLIPLISAASLRWRWAQQELKTVTTRDFNRRRIRVLPARIDGSALPDYLANQPYLDFQGRGWRQAYEDLKAVIQRRTSPRPEPRPTQGFELPHAIRRAQPASERASHGRAVFVSYDYENDGYYKDILLTWSKSPDFPRFSFNDQPPRVRVESEEATPLKHLIQGKIRAATAFLCVVGPNTSTNGWIDWEIGTAIELDKRMVVVRTNRDCVAPAALSEVGPTCALSFTFEGIKRAVDEAYGVVAAE
jgi:hypothetical protein